MQEDIGKRVTRWMGSPPPDFWQSTFVDLRDRAGITQAVFNVEDAPERTQQDLREYVIAVMVK